MGKRKVCENQYTFKTQLHTTKKVNSHIFIIFCVSVQLSRHVILGINVSIAYWFTLYELGNEKPLQAHENVSQGSSKLVLDLPNCPRGPNFVVGGGAQDVLEGVVVHHEGIVTGGPDIIRTSYHGGASKFEFQHLQILVDGRGPDFLTSLPFRVNYIFHNSWPSTVQGDLIPLNMNFTMAWVFSNFMEL